MEIIRHGVGPRMSELQLHAGVAYLAGLTGDGDASDVAGQTRSILAQIDALLAKVGSDKSKLLRVEIWLSDIRHFEAMNAVWDAWVAPGNTPGRATCEAKMAHPSVLVEMIATAAV